MPQSKLLDQVRTAIRLRHYSIRTEEAYVQWVRRFILYHKKRHPREMGADEIRPYLSHLAADENVAAATQNVALAALLFLYREVGDESADLLRAQLRRVALAAEKDVLTHPPEVCFLGA